MSGSTPWQQQGRGGAFNDLDRPCWACPVSLQTRPALCWEELTWTVNINGHQHLQGSGLPEPAGSCHSEWQQGGECQQATGSPGSSRLGPLQAAFPAQPPSSSTVPSCHHPFGPGSVRNPRLLHCRLFCPLPTPL